MIKIVTILWLLSAPVWAHEWYDHSCCGGQHCHPVDAEEVVEKADGSWVHLPTGMVFTPDMVKPSQDGHYHICTVPDETGTQTPRCIYILMGS